jgi:HTH-type transcriptional regulator/antitoxin HipB
MPYKAYNSEMKSLPLQTPAQLSAHLRSLRKARGLTQAAFGALVGLDQTRIAKIERDPQLVSVAQLMKLLSALRVRVLLEPLPEKSQAGASHERTDW